MLDTYYTYCEKPNQKLHRVLNWKETLVTSNTYTVLRIREKDTNILLAQLVIDFSDCAWIYYLAVHPKYRENGLGTSLMEKAEELIRLKGYRTIKLQAQLDFEDRLIPWYEKLGYKKLQRNPKNNEFVFMKKL